MTTIRRAGRRAPGVAVVIPAYSWPQHIEEAIASAVDQATVLCIVDGRSVGHNYRQTADRDGVYWLQIDRHLGVAGARNAGFHWAIECGFDFVVPLDEDDTLRPGFVRGVAALQRISGVSIVYPNCACFGDDDKQFSWGEYNLDRLRREPFIPVTSLISVQAWIDVLDSNGVGFDPALNDLGCEDWLFFLEASALGHHAAYWPFVGFNWRRHPGQRTARVEGNISAIAAHIETVMKDRYGIDMLF